MWAIRKTSIRIKFQLFSSVIFRGSYAKSETSSSSYIDNTGFPELPQHISDRSLTLRRFHSQNSLIGKHSFFSKAFSSIHDATGDVVQGKKVKHESEPFESEDEDNDITLGLPQSEQDLSDNVEGATEHNHERRRAFSGLFNAIIDSSSKSVKEDLDKRLEKGNDLSKKEISFAMCELRRRSLYRKAFQLSEWLEAQEKVEFGERDYASRVDLIAKLQGLQKVENYIEEKIPESFRGVLVYQALLANYVFNRKTTKAEQVFNKIKKLKLPITTFACNQMLLLYKRLDRTKMVDVLLLMEKENIKPSLCTYRLLVDIKARCNDLAGMEQILENMKGEGLQPDLRFQVILAQHYVNFGIIEKAKTILKEMKGDNNLNEKWWVCSYLLPIYASLGSLDGVKRVWEVCETNPRLHECMNAINAFGKLKKVEEAEAVFYYMLRNWKSLWVKHYIPMLKVYAYNKMFYEGKSIVKRINESGCGIGPESLDALVKFYLEADEIEEAGLILNMGPPRINGRPFHSTYMMILEEYAKRGDVDNAETIFMRMRHDGYVLRRKMYSTLLLAYINSKTPAYGFRKRLFADGIIPCKLTEARLARADAYM